MYLPDAAILKDLRAAHEIKNPFTQLNKKSLQSQRKSPLQTQQDRTEHD